VPVKVANHIHDVGHARATAKDKAIGDMCLIAFYFLLRVGEYTSHRKGANTRTVQFRARDIVFWDENLCRIPNEASLEKLLQAHSATMTIDNQKNGTRGGTIHQNALKTQRCPIKGLARRVHHIMSHANGSPDDIISTYFTPNGRSHILHSYNITTAVKTAVKATGLVEHGFPLTCVSSHSLRAGGAMAMHLNKIDRDTIRKMGRWSSDTFLMYIHEQILAFSLGVSKKMSTEIGWHNIEGPTYNEDPAAAAA
jgi:hypothetical protein